MSEQDLFIFVVGGVVTAIAFWGLIAFGVLAFRRWQVEQELAADEGRGFELESAPPEWIADQVRDESGG